MPNYNYRSGDYMRRSQYQRQLPVTSAKDDRSNACCNEERFNTCCKLDLLNGMPVAMAYVPWQEWQNLYSAEKALCKGTIFEDLDKPFLGIGGCQK